MSAGLPPARGARDIPKVGEAVRVLELADISRA